MKRCCLVLFLMLLTHSCQNGKPVFVKGKIIRIEYKTIGRGYYRTKFLCSYNYQGTDNIRYALGQVHFSAMAEADIGDSVLIKFDNYEKNGDGIVRDVFYFEKDIYGRPVDNSYYKGKYNQLE